MPLLHNTYLTQDTHDKLTAHLPEIEASMGSTSAALDRIFSLGLDAAIAEVDAAAFDSAIASVEAAPVAA